jgi:hypothetical protein
MEAPDQDDEAENRDFRYSTMAHTCHYRKSRVVMPPVAKRTRG